MKQIKIILGILLLLALLSQSFAQSGFNVGATICAPVWQCTAFSDVTCGTRTCIDANICGFNYGKPAEYIACESSSGGGGSKRNDTNITVNVSKHEVIPSNFELSADIIKIDIYKGQQYDRKFIIKALSADNFSIGISYPKKYSGPKFVSVEPLNVFLPRGQLAEVSIKVDSKNVSIGTYVMNLNIGSRTSSKSVTVIVNVNPQASIFDFTLDIPLYNKIIDTESFTETSLTFRGLVTDKVNISYSLIDANGVSVFLEAREVNVKESNDVVNYQIAIPKNIASGYYVLAVKVQAASEEKSRYEVFALLPSTQYHEVKQSPSEVIPNVTSNIAPVVYLVVILAAIIIAITVLSKVQASRKRVVEAFIEKERQFKSFEKEQEMKPTKEAFGKKGEKKQDKAKPVSTGRKHSSILEKNCPIDKALMFTNGITVTSLYGLMQTLKVVSDDVFKFHAQTGKNDFSGWVLEVFKDSKTASKIEKANTRHELIKTLERI